MAHLVGGATGASLAGAARAAFMSGLRVSFSVGALVALGAVLIVVAYLPSSAASTPVSADAGGPDEAASLNLPTVPLCMATRLTTDRCCCVYYSSHNTMRGQLTLRHSCLCVEVRKGDARDAPVGAHINGKGFERQ